ncbi:unnamed protein product [Ectocarpus sp. CCAP 1310/34]|nr:unnamed protein product [Ectocarpus sp. CCAP 1310/34]
MKMTAPVSSGLVAPAPTVAFAVLSAAVPTRPIWDTSVAPGRTGSDEGVPHATLFLLLPCAHQVRVGLLHGILNLLKSQIRGAVQKFLLYLVVGREGRH